MSANDNTMQYIQELFCQQGASFESVYHDAPAESQKIQINAPQGGFLNVILSIVKAKNVLEIGTCFAYSTLWIANAIKEQNGTVYSIEKSEQNYKIASNNIASSDLAQNIKLICGDAKEVLNDAPMKKLHQSFDAVFIDANKSSYLSYLKFCDLYLKNGGLVIADNALQNNMVCEKNESPSRIARKVHEFNVALSKNYRSIIIPAFDGIAIGIKQNNNMSKCNDPLN